MTMRWRDPDHETTTTEVYLAELVRATQDTAIAVRELNETLKTISYLIGMKV